MDPQEIPFGSQGHFEEALPVQDRAEGQESTSGWLYKDAPWVLGMSSDVAPYFPPFENNGAAFQTYRTPYLPSDCGDTQPGDSGYGKSIETTSIRGEDSFHAGSNCVDVEHNFGRLHLAPEPYEGATPIVYEQNGHLSPPIHGDGYICKCCRHPFRNRSELKKHEARHERPFTCEHKKCAKYTVGFASQNDLVRHKRTVHGENLNGPLYVCNHDECAKQTTPKRWPRADNFRSHLRRVHAIDVKPDFNLGPYRYQHLSEDLQGVGTQLLELPTEPSFPNAQHSQADGVSVFSQAMQFPTTTNVPQYDQEASLDGMSPYLNGSYMNRQRSDSVNLSPTIEQYPQIHVRLASPESASGHGLKIEPPGSPLSQHKCETESSTPESISDVEIFPLSTSPVSETDSEMEKERDSSLHRLQKCFTSASQQEQLEFLSSLSKDVLQSALRGIKADESEPDLQSIPSSKTKVKCTTCQKGFNRPCDLKKHYKRHDKPYGCTIRLCDKSFGSKNDWKRHESQQHTQIQTWYCDPSCDTRFSDREGFKSHLESSHRYTEAFIETKLEENREDIQSASSFWCGFCREMISFPASDIEHTTSRFNHIDDHFMGRQGRVKQTIAEWKHMEDLPPLRRQVRHRQRGGLERNLNRAFQGRKRKLGSPSESRPRKQPHTHTTAI